MFGVAYCRRIGPEILDEIAGRLENVRRTAPDFALMSFVKYLRAGSQPRAIFRWSVWQVMIMQRWRQSLKTSVIKL